MARQRSGIMARAEYSALSALRAALAKLPLARAVRVGAAAGALVMELDRVNRPIAMRNLEIGFPDKSVEQRTAILRAMYRNWGRMAAEWAHFGAFNRNNIERYVRYRNRNFWEEAQRVSAGRGIIAFTGHFGNFELLNYAHSMYGNPIAFVYRPVRNAYFDRELSEVRRRFGTLLIDRKDAGRRILRALAEDWMVCIPVDLDVRHGVFVDFFSLKASMTDALGRLAIVTGTPVLPAFMVREGASTLHHITFLEPIEIVKTRDRRESIRENSQRCATVFEAMIRRHPDHWNWIHRRWKTRPPGEQRFY